MNDDDAKWPLGQNHYMHGYHAIFLLASLLIQFLTFFWNDSSIFMISADATISHFSLFGPYHMNFETKTLCSFGVFILLVQFSILIGAFLYFIFGLAFPI